MLEMAHSLGIKSLKLNLERKIIKNHLGKDNATKLALESKIFDLKKLNKECINYISQNFKDVKIFKNDIIDLDFDSFKNLMNSDEINIETEKDISEFILDYIKSRRDLPEEEKEKETEIKPNENENKEENKNIEENQENANNEEKKEEEKKEEGNEENKDNKEKDDENEKWKKYLYELKDSTKRKKLSKEQEKELIMCIRFSYLPHTELTKLISEPVMSEFKDILLQALSLKLNSYEGTQNNLIDTKIFNSSPRLCYQNIDNNNNNNLNNNDFNQQNINDYNINQSMPNPNNLNNPNYFNNKNSFIKNIPNNNRMYKSEFYNNNNNNNRYHKFKNNYNMNINEEEYQNNNPNNNIDNYNDY